MSQLKDPTDETHTIEWRIENFSHCNLEPGTRLESIASDAGNLYDTRWRLLVYPKGKRDAPDYLGFFLKRDIKEKVGPEKIHVEFEFSLVTADGVQTFTEIGSDVLERGAGGGFPKFAKLEDILCRKESLLHGDALTVRCKIRRLNPKKKQTCFEKFVTNFPIEKTSISLTLQDFRKIRKENPKVVDLRGSKNLLSLRVSMNKDDTSEEMTVSMSKDDTSEKIEESGKPECSMDSFLHFVVAKEKSEDTVQVSCCIKLLDEKKEVAIEKSFSHLFSKLEEDQWILPHFLDTSTLDKGCIEDGRLNFEVDFTVCDDQQSWHIADLTPLSLRPNPKETTLMKDLDNLRKNGKFSDVILRIGEDTLPAHMSFLAERSPRFDDIFVELKKKSKNQMQEVEITDVDKKTFELMLQFIYNDKLEEMDDESCLLLYSAAHKYQISSLIIKCASILRSNLSAKRVNKVLHIAEQFGDSELKMKVLDYIVEHYEYVLLTPEWQEFSEEHEELSDQVMAYIRLKKQEKCD